MKVLMKVTNKNGQYMGREVSEGDAPRKRKAGAGERSEENRIFEEAYLGIGVILTHKLF